MFRTVAVIGLLVVWLTGCEQSVAASDPDIEAMQRRLKQLQAEVTEKNAEIRRLRRELDDRDENRDEKRLIATCDNIYVALNGEVANELDTALLSDASEAGCRARDAWEVARCAVYRHEQERNPRNPNQPAYVEGETATDPCQVEITATSENSIRFSQQAYQGAHTRTFSITID